MPMTESIRAHELNTRLKSPLGKLVQVLVLMILALSGTILRAQTVEIKLVNGKNGRPMANQCISVWVGDRSKPSSGPLLNTQTDRSGVTTIRLADEDTKVSVDNEHLACGLLGVINPTVKFGNTISIRTGYASCKPHAPNYSWLAMMDFSTGEALRQGIVTPNVCGKATAVPKAGEVIVFVRPLSWWEKLKQ